ncbi:hypothetical protein ACFSTC_28550 [Nonomuraea ferruginea]
MIDMLPIRSLIATTMVATTTGLLAVPAQAVQQATPTLVGIRAAHHNGLDRLVFEFRGRVPDQRDVRYVSKLIADGSGRAGERGGQRAAADPLRRGRRPRP